MKVVTRWLFEAFKDGVPLWSEQRDNLVTTQGLIHILDSTFLGGTQITDWYVGIMGDHTPVAANTYQTPGFTELTTYSETDRPAWTGPTAGTLVSASADNGSSRAVFTFTADTTVYGAFLCGGGTASDSKGDTADTDAVLFSQVQFDTEKLMYNGTVLRATVTVIASGS